MNLLKFNLIYQEHPYPEAPGSNFDKWGQICIFLLKEKTSERIEILDTQWDLSSLVNWFYKKVDIVPSRVFQINNNIQVLPQESLAQAEFRLRQADYDDDDDSIFDTLYEFRENNALRHQLRGTDIADIIVGNNGGKGEISLYNEIRSWRYEFDIDDFVQNMRLSVRNFENFYN